MLPKWQIIAYGELLLTIALWAKALKRIWCRLGCSHCEMCFGSITFQCINVVATHLLIIEGEAFIPPPPDLWDFMGLFWGGGGVKWYR